MMMEAQHQPSSDDLSASNLADVMQAYEVRGHALPVAVAVSVLDDVLQLPDADRVSPSVEDVMIGPDGVAYLSATKPGRVENLASVVSCILGNDHDALPHAAHVLIARVSNPETQPVDAAQLRDWVRSSLGPPASREEVVALLHALEEDDVHEAATLLPEDVGIELSEAPLPLPELVEDDDSDEVLAPTLPPEPTESPSVAPSSDVSAAPLASDKPYRPIDRERVRAATLSSYPETRDIPQSRTDPTHLTEIAAPAPSDVDEERPVVRLNSGNARPISLAAAPAARRSARAISNANDSIILPAERRGNWLVWIGVLVIVALVLYFYVI